MLGLYRGTVIVEPHNIEWEITAQQTISKLKNILGSVISDAQHIGSTSIKNICAKPIIDLVVGVEDFDALFEMNDILEENGFLFRGQDHPEQYLYICGEGDFVTHHIHTVRYDSEVWQNYINMRDYLNCHTDDAKAYEELKLSLAVKYPNDRNTYTAMKSVFIGNIHEKAREWKK